MPFTSTQILTHLSYHAVYDDSILSALEYAKDNGFSGIQVAVEAPHFDFGQISSDERAKIKEYLDQNKLYLTIHGPDDVTSLFIYNDILRQGVLDYFRALFDFATQVTARIITLHLGSKPSFATDTEPERRLTDEDADACYQTFRANLKELITLVNKRFILCLEYYKYDDQVQTILQPFLDNNQISLCWDVAKVESDVEPFFIKNLKHVKQVHLHDNRPIDHGKLRSHRVIGTGQVDFIDFFKKIADAEILDYCVEVRPREKAKESLENLKYII